MTAISKAAGAWASFYGVAAVCVLAGCSDAPFSTGEPDANGTSGTAGGSAGSTSGSAGTTSGSAAGATGTGGGSGSEDASPGPDATAVGGGRPDASPPGDGGCVQASIEFELRVASGGTTSYCAGSANSCAADWLSIRPAGGPVLSISAACTTECSVCQPVACPALCIAPTVIPSGGIKQGWNGAAFTTGTCGAGVSCVSPSCATPGHYIATMCGRAEVGAAPVGSCNATTSPTCVEVPFEWPPVNGTVVTGVLGGTEVDAGSCCPGGWDLYSCAFPDGGAGHACHNPVLGCASSQFCGQGCDQIVSGRCDDGG